MRSGRNLRFGEIVGGVSGRDEWLSERVVLTVTIL